MSVNNKILKLFMIVLSIMTLAACKTRDTSSGIEDSTDQLYSEKKYDETVYVFQMEGMTYMIEPAYTLNYYVGEFEDGHFYKLQADITYLNGGIAGYVNYPQIDDVNECTEISPFELDLPKISEKRYGLLLIGDYADGDLFLNEYFKRAVWKDGEWIYHYDSEADREDGSRVCYRKDVSMEMIEEGIKAGILSCEDYFVLPAID